MGWPPSEEPIDSDVCLFILSDRNQDYHLPEKTRKESADQCLSSHLQSSFKWEGKGIQMILTLGKEPLMPALI